MCRRSSLSGHWQIPRFHLLWEPTLSSCCHPMIFLMARAGGAPQENKWISSAKNSAGNAANLSCFSKKRRFWCDQRRIKGSNPFHTPSAIPVFLRVLQIQVLTHSTGQATAP